MQLIFSCGKHTKLFGRFLSISIMVVRLWVIAMCMLLKFLFILVITHYHKNKQGQKNDAHNY